jgi:hypothetical protein
MPDICACCSEIITGRFMICPSCGELIGDCCAPALEGAAGLHQDDVDAAAHDADLADEAALLRAVMTGTDMDGAGSVNALEVPAIRDDDVDWDAAVLDQ